MRSIFYVALAVGVLARSSVVAAFTNADESQLLSKTSPDFAADALISMDSRKRFLRVTDPEDDDLVVADEEQTKYGSLSAIIKKLDEKEMGNAASILKPLSESAHVKSALKSGLTPAEYRAANALLRLSKSD
ncbi:hypothetical protein PI124_g18417 [Phytophthora idaei]|nr:hypothetical protein PI124_g18417 [Phytophthora idaei]